MNSHSVSDYFRALRQLLPSGFAWQWPIESIGSRCLTVIACELQRLHVLLESIATYNIERWSGNFQGWTAADYQNLLLEKFGIQATVTDGIAVTSCESSCEDFLLEDRISYVYVVTVDDVSAIPSAVYVYLKQYQQSHTHFHFRDKKNELVDVVIARALQLGEETPGALILSTSRAGAAEASDELIDDAIRIDRMYVSDGMHCQSPLYEQSFYKKERSADWSWTAQERDALSET